MKDDDLYPRYQTLAALINVLLHDLRNPLHSATLLVEAMGSRSADVEALRGKLRGQFGKLEGLISESSDAIKELALEARIQDLAVDEIVRTAVESARRLVGTDVDLVASEPTGLRASTDAVLIVRAIGEIAATLAERSMARDPNERVRIAIAVDEPDHEHVRLVVGGWIAPRDDAAVKAPFAIAGGGVRLAVARSLAQVASATLRLEQSPEGAIRYALHLTRA
jgi:signal transduction histidine kinase